jgi:hypothetical protein
MAEVMVEQTTKIANSLDTLQKAGLPKDLIVLYVQKKTRLNRRDIEAVFEALKDFQKQVKLPSQ